jgi:hypothetical protein
MMFGAETEVSSKVGGFFLAGAHPLLGEHSSTLVILRRS